MSGTAERVRSTAAIAFLFLLAASARAEIVVFDVGSSISNSAAIRSDSQAYSQSRQIRYSFTLRNERNTPLDRAHLWVWAPVRQTATQWCRRIETSRAAELAADARGNQTLHFVVTNLPPFGTRIVAIKADLVLAAKPLPAAGDNLAAYVRPGAGVESDAPDIMVLGRSLGGGTPRETARRAFDWVAKNLRDTGYHPVNRGALWALKNRQGDCSEFTSLFAALCRVNGVPARRLAGFVCRENTVLKPHDLHNVNEFQDGPLWRFADPFHGKFDSDAANYVALRILDGVPDNTPAEQQRLFRWEGEGINVSMNP